MKLVGGDGLKARPQGSCSYDRPPRHVRDAEAIIENSNFNLSCSKPGCGVELKKEHLEFNEIICVFRKVSCPDLKCEN